jgi:hypothetical protein
MEDGDINVACTPEIARDFTPGEIASYRASVNVARAQFARLCVVSVWSVCQLCQVDLAGPCCGTHIHMHVRVRAHW